jgi:mediator of RNA polymerase II transcription subunit 4
MNSTPIAEQLLVPLNNLDALALSLFHSLSPPTSRPPPPPPPPIDAFLQCDAAIAHALKVARIHQSRQQRIHDLQDELVALEKQLAVIFTDLENGRLALEDILAEAADRTQAINTARSGTFLSLSFAQLPVSLMLSSF